jgi:hypothetical protein
MEDEDLGSELERELEKLRRRQKMARRHDNGDEDGYVKRKGRLAPYDKTARKFDWKTEVEGEEDLDGHDSDD